MINKYNVVFVPRSFPRVVYEGLFFYIFISISLKQMWLYMYFKDINLKKEFFSNIEGTRFVIVYDHCDTSCESWISTRNTFDPLKSMGFL